MDESQPPDHYLISRDRHLRLSASGPETRWIVVSVATKNCDGTLPRAVASLLEQTHEELLVVVTSDGDGDSPFRALGELALNPRVLPVEVPLSRGCFYVHDVVLRATPTQLFAIQDADDRSTPSRFSRLWKLLQASEADAAFGGVRKTSLNGEITNRAPRRWEPGPLLHFVGHFGLFRRDALIAVGGYYGGVPFGYDTFITASLAALGRCAATNEVVYEKFERSGSLTRSAATGHRTSARMHIRAELQQRYQAMLSDPDQLRHQRDRYVSVEDRLAMDAAALELRARISTRLEMLGS
jgi:Glycosyl transferase family 2